ncbi:MAG: aminotransferase class I/II-fold pyridoxal phosphate-dependent enzyme [Patescibacteria group bacterium]
MALWDAVPLAHPDPIFAIAEEARAAGSEAIDATIGVYIDEKGQTKLFPSVKKAMTEVLSDYASGSFTYTPLLGIPEYRSAVTELILPNASLPVASCATAGGTGSLAINLRMLKLLESNIRLCLPTPAWANHAPLCRSAGVAFEELAVLENGVVRCDVIIDWIRNTSGVRAILLQAGCTNPTGIDLSKDQWKEIMPVLKDSECIVLLDVAYQGFGSDPDTDAAPARGLVSEGIPVLISWSASKNHSVYRLRTGMALACVPDEHTRKRVEGHYSTLSRGLWSTAPDLGQSVVARTQSHHKKEWLDDLAHVRGTLERKRTVLRENLPEAFQAALGGIGMFATLPLSAEQITLLKTKHNVFILNDGRINIAGIPGERLEEFCEKIQTVL